jgi:hypothetical protein
MPTQYIGKKYGVNTSTPIADDAAGRLKLQNLPTAAGIAYDKVSNQLKYNKNGTIVTVLDSLSDVSALTTTTNIGAPNGATVSAVETGSASQHQTVLTLTALPLTLAESDGANGAGVKIYDFPAGVITILSAVGTVAETTTSTLATTLNASKTYNWGVGTVTQSNAVLVTTEQDILNATDGVSSATINVPGAASTGGRSGSSASFNGTGTPIDAYFNVGIAVDDDIDDPATTTWTGTITITWLFGGAA